MARKIILALGVLFLLAGGLLWWRATHPPLTDTEQIVANLEGLRSAAESGSVDGVLSYFADDFTWNGRKRSEIRSLLFAGMHEGLRKRDIRVTFTNVHPDVKGAAASLSGHYKLDIRNYRGSLDSMDGEFSTQWEKRDGQWKITRAQGGEALQ